MVIKITGQLEMFMIRVNSRFEEMTIEDFAWLAYFLKFPI
jgi:hypothetical protein